MRQADYAIVKMLDETLIIWVWEGKIKSMLFTSEVIGIDENYVELRDIARPKK
jgi:hypothetical protein